MTGGMTRAELLALPAAVDIRTAGRAFGFGERKTYDLVRRGEFPCRVLRLGNAYRVPTADLLAVLGLAGHGAGPAPPAPAPPTRPAASPRTRTDTDEANHGTRD